MSRALNLSQYSVVRLRIEVTERDGSQSEVYLGGIVRLDGVLQMNGVMRDGKFSHLSDILVEGAMCKTCDEYSNDERVVFEQLLSKILSYTGGIK